MYLGGEGGTSKTRIIEALMYLSNSCQQSRAVRTCAPTGKAACLVRGKTVHSLLGIHAGASFIAKKRLSEKTKEEHVGTLMLIIDEVSMLSRKHLGAIDIFSRKVKECDILFGGVVVVLSGNFYQIPPVASEPIFLNPQCSKRQSTILDVIGYEAWRSVEHVVTLQESMRHSEDCKFRDCLRQIRHGKVNDEDLRLLNNRVITREQAENSLINGHTHLVVRTNELRMGLNWKAVEACCQSLGNIPVVYVAEIRHACGGYLSAEDLDIVMTTEDIKMSNLAALLPLCRNMPVRITHNIAVELGIANGAEGVLAGVSFQPGTTFQEANIFGVSCLVCTKLPNALFFRSELFKKTLPSCYPDLPMDYSMILFQ